MILIDGVPVLANIPQIMYCLQRELRTSSVPYLQTIKPPREYQDLVFTCPYHKDGRENRPSCCITTITKEGVPVGTVHCFTCGKTSYITEMISYCFNKHDGGVFGKSWILDRFESADSGNRRGFFSLPCRKKEKEQGITYVSEEELESYRFIHPYLYKRGMTDELIEMFDLGYDKDLKAVTFPIKDMNGKVLFVAKRSVRTKRFYLPRKLVKPLCYIYEAKQYYPNSNTLYICESLFNALTLYRWGVPAIALLGTGTKEQLEAITYLPYRTFVICLDNDMAGEMGRKKLAKVLDKKAFLRYIITKVGTDINDYVFDKDFLTSHNICANINQDKHERNVMKNGKNDF